MSARDDLARLIFAQNFCLDPDGEPRAGYRVWDADASEFARSDVSQMAALRAADRILAAGWTLPAQGEARVMEDAGEQGIRRAEPTEAQIEAASDVLRGAFRALLISYGHSKVVLSHETDWPAAAIDAARAALRAALRVGMSARDDLTMLIADKIKRHGISNYPYLCGAFAAKTAEETGWAPPTQNEACAEQVAVPAGWRLVPEEPTLEMLEAGRDAARATHISGVSGMTIDAQVRSMCAREAAAYAAMIAAAPEPKS